MKRSICAFALLVVAANSPTAGQRGTYHIFGAGVNSCGEWRRDVDGSTGHLFHVMWIAGFLSGAGYAGPIDSLRVVDNRAIEAWLNDYCATHPLNQLAVAAAALLGELKQ